MIEIENISELPTKPAVYALCDKSNNIAYIGIATKLKQRIKQHLVRQDSSVTTGQSAVIINPDNIKFVKWWEDALFSDKDYLIAAEEIAIDILKPIYRSLKGISTENPALKLLNDEKFVNKTTQIFQKKPTGIFTIQTLDDAIIRISELEKRLTDIEKHLKLKF